MKSLIEKINELKNEEISETINQRIKEFSNIKNNKEKVFSELCFCILTANFKAERSIFIQEQLEKDFFETNFEELAKKLKELGHRFWPQRAERIVLAREKFNDLYSLINKLSSQEIREWIVKNIKGLGMKESSHFLRNIGFLDLAIIDFHIIDLLVNQQIIEKPKTMNPKKYLEIEETLKNLGEKINMNLSELDLYLWYIETGKVLK